jgi:hypothetical protein
MQKPTDGQVRAAEREAALREGRLADALRVVTVGAWERVHRVLRDLDVTVAEHGETESPSVMAYALGMKLHGIAEKEDDPPHIGLVAAANVCLAIAGAWGAIEGRTKKEFASDVAFAQTFWGVLIGEADTILSLWESGFLTEATAAKLKFNSIGAHLRGRIPPWEAAVLPHLQKYCVGKTEVSLGELVRQAKQAPVVVRGTGIPTTDEGIRAGLKRMIGRGELVVPGYSAPSQQG